MNKNSGFLLRNFTWLFWVLLVVLLAAVFFLAVRRHFNHDEFQHIHTAWKILNGEKIYVDFFQNHHPFFYYVLAGIIAVFGENVTTILAMRIFSFLMLLLIILTAYCLSERIFKNRQISLIAILLLAATMIFVDLAIEIRPDVPQTLFGLVSILWLFTYLENKQTRYLILSSVFMAISFLVLQKAVFTVLLVGIFLLISAYKKYIQWRAVFIYGAAGILTVAPYYVYLLYSGSLSAYFTFNWLINMKWAYSFTAFTALGYILRTSTLLVIFYIWGLLKFTKTVVEIRLGWLSLGLLASNFLIRCPYKQSFMISIPFMVIIAANAMYSLFKERQKLLAVVLLIAVAMSSIFIFNRFKKDNVQSIEMIEYVLSITEPADYVYDGNAAFNLFRKDIDFFWFAVQTTPPKYGALVTYRTIAEYHYDIYELIEKFKPKVISDFEVDIQNEIIANHYVPSKRYEGLLIRNDGKR